MKIHRFCNYDPKDGRPFDERVKHLVGKLVYFKGENEPGEFHFGQFSELDGDTVLFANHSVYQRQEILIAEKIEQSEQPKLDSIESGTSRVYRENAQNEPTDSRCHDRITKKP